MIESVNVLEVLLGALVERVAHASTEARRRWRHRSDVNELAAGHWAHDELVRVRELEFRRLTDAEWQLACDQLTAALGATDVTNPAMMLEHGLSPTRLKESILAAGRSDRHQRDVGRAVSEAYEFLLTYACTRAIELAQADPDFTALALTKVIRDIWLVLEQTSPRRGVQDFEHRYLSLLAERLGTFEMFGLRPSGPRAESQLIEAYVNLRVARRSAADAGAELSGAGLPIASAFEDQSRVLLLGEAGAGKTTFLRRQAAHIARRAITSDADDLVPLLVQLRLFAGRPLPTLADLPGLEARALAGACPDGWVPELFASGRALLLVDGVDDLTGQQRPMGLDWLRDLVTAYPQARYLVTSRPAALTGHWLGEHGFVEFDLLPMGRDAVRTFIERWHVALDAVEPGDAETREFREERRQRLFDNLAEYPELRHMAESPLLCALICSLNLYRRLTLPPDRQQLYDEALDWLLEGWDRHREVHPVRPWSKVEEPKALLQRFAHAMLINGELSIERETALRRVQSGTAGMTLGNDADGLLAWFLERSGVLRNPTGDRVEFVHRTFRDFLGAREFVDNASLPYLVSQAHLDAWRDVVVMAVAHARPRERTEFLRSLLAASAKKQPDPRMRDQLRLVAARP